MEKYIPVIIMLLFTANATFGQAPADKLDWQRASELTKKDRGDYVRKIGRHIELFSNTKLATLKGKVNLNPGFYTSSKKKNRLDVIIKDTDHCFYIGYNYSTGKLTSYDDMVLIRRAEKVYFSKRIEPEEYQHQPREALEKAVELIKDIEGVDVTDKQKWQVKVGRDFRQLTVTCTRVFHGHRLAVGQYIVSFSDIDKMKICSYSNSWRLPIPEYKKVPDVILKEKAVEISQNFLKRAGYLVEEKPEHTELMVILPRGYFTEIPEKYSYEKNDWMDKDPVWVWRIVFRRIPSKVFVNWNNIPIQVNVDAITGKVVDGAD